MSISKKIAIYGGKIADYSALGKLKELSELFLNGRLRRWQENFDFLQYVPQLQAFSILHYPLFKTFPNLEKLSLLKKLKIEGCKRLTDISAVNKIPHLQSLGIVSTPQKVGNLEFIARMPTLKTMSGAFCSQKEDNKFMELLEKYGLTYG